MWAFFLKVWKWVLKIPVLFAHFPGPTVMLSVIAIGCAAAAAAWITHGVEAGARAVLRAEIAETRELYARQHAAAAEGRAATIETAWREKVAIDRANAEFMREALQAFIDARNAGAPALAALGKKIEELHHDAKFACRRDPLPGAYTDGLRIPAGPVSAAAAGAAGDHPRQ